MKNESTSLKHTITTKDIEGNNLIINIRLDDECKNGHQDFAITCSAYAKGKPMNDHNFIYGGCAHDEILKARPELEIFVRLHLCDHEGIPMYAIANGMYHIKSGFNSQPAGTEAFKTSFCGYYRVTSQQYDILAECQNAVKYGQALEKLGILAAWKEEADKAIKILEGMTGEKFIVSSTRSALDKPDQDVIDREEKREREGYYTPEATKAREDAKKQEFIKGLKKEMNKKIHTIRTEFLSLKTAFEILGSEKYSQVIFYNHTNTLGVNWRGYGQKLTPDEIALLTAAMPEGVKVEERN